MYKQIKKIIVPTVLSTGFLFSLFSYAFASTVKTSFTETPDQVYIGDSVNVNLRITPELGFPVYTVGTTINYDPTALEFVDSNFSETWFALNKSPYKNIDTQKGIITLTAGYPAGTDLPGNFLTYSFKALKVGFTPVTITDGFAYDDKNVKNPVQKSNISINIQEPIVQPQQSEPLQVEIFTKGPIGAAKSWIERYFLSINLFYWVLILALFIVVLKLLRRIHQMYLAKKRHNLSKHKIKHHKK